MPMSRPARAGRRGPIARQPPKTPSGFRVDDRTRFELQAAALYTGCDNLQCVLDRAVTEFLERLRAEEGFLDTLRTAERAQQRRAGVRGLVRKPETDDPRDA
jgi:hypothetical protein